MPEQPEKLANDLSPWAHPNAQRWFQDMFERQLFPSSLDDEIVAAMRDHEPEKIRCILALFLLLVRDGIWPADRNSVLKSAIRAADHISKNASLHAEKKPLTLAEHRGQAVQSTAIQEEIELLRRRLKMSNRKTTLQPPKTWGNLWE